MTLETNFFDDENTDGKDEWKKKKKRKEKTKMPTTTFQSNPML